MVDERIDVLGKIEVIVREWANLRGHDRCWDDHEYIERIARDDLNMQKDGEMVLVLQDNENLQITDTEPNVEKEKENWEKWLDILR